MARYRALRDMQSMLQARSSNLRAVSLPEPHNTLAELDTILAVFAGRHKHLQMQAGTMISQMNDDQFSVFTTVHDAVLPSQPPPTAFYLDGKAGRGKTFVAAALCHIVRASGEVTIVAISSALSVAIYERGLTAHSIFGIPISQVCFKTFGSSYYMV